MDVTEWRAQLWQRATREATNQEISASAAAEVQAIFDERRLALFKFEPGVSELVALLRSRGIAMVIITNGNATIQRDKLEACRAAEHFTHILVGGGATYASKCRRSVVSNAVPIYTLTCTKLAGQTEWMQRRKPRGWKKSQPQASLRLRARWQGAVQVRPSMLVTALELTFKVLSMRACKVVSG